MDYRILNGDCAEEMKRLDDCSVDAVVTDPPYGLAFMGRDWDYDVPSPAYWHEALRVAKHGAHLLCFGGTRTFHRMACAIEEAGWEIRDCIMWVYGSGFPKSMNVGKAIDKLNGYVGEVVGERTVDVGMQGGNMHAGRERKLETQEVRALSEEASKWDGWGTCLKPAWEPIIVACKPLDGTVAHNVMEHGTGALNIDGCRVGTDVMVNQCAQNKPGGNSLNMSAAGMPQGVAPTVSVGRFPANLVHDGSEEVVALFPESKCGKAGTIRHTKDGERAVYGDFTTGEQITTIAHGGDGSAARFFYCAKASKRDRGEGNDHPTVKPNNLMRWLVRLVCAKGGTALDPFMGSGSTGVACVDEGMDFIGIEREEHYCEIAEQRIKKAMEENAQGVLPI